MDRVTKVDGDKLPVRLIDDDQNVFGHPFQQTSDIMDVHRSSRRVVGVSKHNQLGARRHSLGYSIQIEGLVDQRDGHRSRRGNSHIHRVGLKRRPRVNHLITGIDVGQEELL